jgi:hypothetical protein
VRLGGESSPKLDPHFAGYLQVHMLGAGESETTRSEAVGREGLCELWYWCSMDVSHDTVPDIMQRHNELPSYG